MAELNEPKEPNELDEPNGPAAGGNNVPTPDELAALKVQLEEEQGSVAEARAQLTERDDQITQLQFELDAANNLRDATAAELEAARHAHAGAVAKYLESVKAANPMLPQDVIQGQTIEDIDRSLGTALSIAGAVQANLEAQAQHTRVPAGAPTRVIDMDALTPQEKIKVGLSQEKGGS